MLTLTIVPGRISWTGASRRDKAMVFSTKLELSGQEEEAVLTEKVSYYLKGGIYMYPANCLKNKHRTIELCELLSVAF